MNTTYTTNPLSSRLVLASEKKGTDTKNTQTSAAIAHVENEKMRAKKVCNATAGAGGGSPIPTFEWQQFEQWMRATCEGAELLRGNNDNDSDSDGASDSDS